jgi:hypothetical protein
MGVDSNRVRTEEAVSSRPTRRRKTSAQSVAGHGGYFPTSNRTKRRTLMFSPIFATAAWMS